MNKKNPAWITWEHQIRNKSMSARLGADYYPIIGGQNRFLRYIKCCFCTVKILFSNIGGIVFVQNPSIVLGFISVILRPIFRYTLVVDAHNAGVFPIAKLQFLADYINKRANYVIVTNEGLASHIKKIGGQPVILPDPLPEITVHADDTSKWGEIAGPSVMVICSWAEDEPYCEIIKAAKTLPDVFFYITGNSKQREQECNCILPENVILTGFVSENDYHLLLTNADVIVDLTTRENCLVCGAYEAISVAKPVMLSDTKALRHYFGDAATYVQNNSKSICDGVRKILDQYAYELDQARNNSIEIERQWGCLFAAFKKEIRLNSRL